MTKGTLFWVIMIICVIFGGLFFWPHGGGGGVGYYGIGYSGAMIVCIGLLGWQVFGAAVK